MDYTKKRINWELYIERKNAFFYVTIFNRAYGQLLRKTTGFGFTHQLYVYKDSLVSFYKSKEELQKANEYYLYLVRKNDPRIKQWHESGLESLREKRELIELFSKIDSANIIKNYDELIDRLYHVYMYHTTIPFMILSAIESSGESENHEAIRDMFEQFRKESLNQMHALVLDKFWRAAAEFTKSEDYISFSFFTPAELGSLFKGNSCPSKDKIEKRKKGCVFYEENNEIVFNYDDGFAEKAGIKTADIQDLKELKGNVAFKGYAKGRVCIINKPYEMKKFKEGDIIISINTTPALMPVLAKSNAIVTDEGGITCHASIISRELRKPCIIGTRFTTRIFKDGDYAEVDAEKGIVRKIGGLE
ncbi:MAG: PEP-utilizing enzyme [Candidatus Woesearchaeota archaeon]|nr:PEP-utilizing enzyme [Candidatus Woesearchaeota archaeon]